MDNKETRKKFMKLLNKYIKDFKSDTDHYYATTREIFNITDNSKYVIDPHMLEYNNDNRKDTQEENTLINSMRDIGRRMTRTGRNTSNYEGLYFELNKHPAFKNFFNNNHIGKSDMYNFAEYILDDYQTKSSEKYARQKQQQQEMKQENETLKGENQILTEENQKKDKKIERRDRRLERINKKYNDLIEQRDKLAEDFNQMKEQHKQETQRIKEFYEKKNDEMSKVQEAEIAKLSKEKNNLKAKYKTKYKEKVEKIRNSMDEKQLKKEKEKILKEINEELNNERTEYEEKIKQQEIKFEEWKKANKEAQRLSLTEIDHRLKEREEEIMNLNKQIEEERKQAEEDKRNIKAESNRVMNENVAKMKNKMEDRHEKDNKELLEEYKQNETEIYGFTPTLERYIKKKLQSQAYSLDEDELIDKIARDIGKPGGLPKGTDPVQVAKAIYNRGAEETIKHIKKIANLAILTGYNHDLYNKLPGDVALEVQRYITDKINDDIRKKNIKYILPKDKPRWEHAMESKKLNPMLGRSAWRVN